VTIGSRSAERAEAAATEYNRLLGAGTIRGLVNRDMLQASDLVFLTLPHDQAAAALEGVHPDLRAGMVLVDVTVPMRFQDGRAEYAEPAEGSNAELLASRLPPEVALVGAFKTIPAHVLAEHDTPLECDVFVCGDDRSARERVMEAAGLIPTLRAVDAGPLRAARTLERMTVLAVHLNRRYKRKGARYRIHGI
jgi:NADPH-dependent F420 reductase